MVFALAACGGNGNNNAAPGGGDNSGGGQSGDTGVKLDRSWPAETVKIGVTAFDTTDESFQAVLEYLVSEQVL